MDGEAYIRLGLGPGRGPGIVLVPSALRPTENARAVADRMSARGYVVVVPYIVRGLDDVAAAISVLEAHPQCDGNVVVIGYGAGGRYAYLGVTRLGAAAGVAFHGIGIGAHLDEASQARAPLSFHFGDDDAGVPFAEVRAIKGALEGFATTEIYRYPGMRQGFAELGSEAYDETAAQLAERRAFAALSGIGNPR